MPTRLITPSQLSMFSISPVIGAWWEELQARKLFGGSKPAVSELDQQLFADGLRHEQVQLTKLQKAGHNIARLPGKQSDADYAATREAIAEGVEFIHQASLWNEEMHGSADLLKRVDRQWTRAASNAKITFKRFRAGRKRGPMKYGLPSRRQPPMNQPPKMNKAKKLRQIQITEKVVERPLRKRIGTLSWFIPVATVVLLSGCTRSRLPACNADLQGNNAKTTSASQTDADGIGQQVLLGIDGSGSMLGYVQANETNVWPRLLQSISQGILLEGLQPISYRIGAGIAEGPLQESTTQATKTCFFIGCEGYRPVASSLETLWTIRGEDDALPLRLLVSDLEVNQSDISSLLTKIQPDISKGASAGILGIKAPFTGNVFGPDGQVIQQGNVIRPIFILATGPEKQVKPVLEEVKKTLSLKGITNTKISIINPKDFHNTRIAKWVGGTPPKAATSGVNIRLGGITYSPIGNTDYQFIRLSSSAKGLSVATTKKWSRGAERPDFGIADIQRMPINEGQPLAAEGMQVSNIEISGSNVKLGIDVKNSAVTGLYRIVIPAGSMPEEWWVSWDRAEGDKTNVGSKTQGLLLLMTTLSRQIAGAANAPPDAAMCIALQN